MHTQVASQWYIDGDNKNGNQTKPGSQNSSIQIMILELQNICTFAVNCSKKEPKEKGKPPAMIVFCAFEQMPMVIDYGKKYGF